MNCPIGVCSVCPGEYIPSEGPVGTWWKMNQKPVSWTHTHTHTHILILFYFHFFYNCHCRTPKNLCTCVDPWNIRKHMHTNQQQHKSSLDVAALHVSVSFLCCSLQSMLMRTVITLVRIKESPFHSRCPPAVPEVWSELALDHTESAAAPLSVVYLILTLTGAHNY